MYKVEYCANFTLLEKLIFDINIDNKTIIAVTQDGKGYTVIYR